MRSDCYYRLSRLIFHIRDPPIPSYVPQKWPTENYTLCAATCPTKDVFSTKFQAHRLMRWLHALRQDVRRISSKLLDNPRNGMYRNTPFEQSTQEKSDVIRISSVEVVDGLNYHLHNQVSRTGAEPCLAKGQTSL